MSEKELKISTNLPEYRVYIYPHSGDQTNSTGIKLYKDGHLGLVTTVSSNAVYFYDYDEANKCAELLGNSNRTKISKAKYIQCDFIDAEVNGIKCMIKKDIFDQYLEEDPSIIRYAIQ